MKEFFRISFIVLTAFFLIFWMPSKGKKISKTQESPWINRSDSGYYGNFVDVQHIPDQGLISGSSDGSVFYQQEGTSGWQKTGQVPVGQANDYYFVNADSGYAVGNNSKVFFTTNRGSSWSQQTTTFQYDHFNAVGFSNTQNGYIVGTTGIIYKTTNGGSNWNYKEGLPSNPDYNNLFTSDSGGAFICGSNGTLIKSTNDGDSWTPVDSKTGLCLFGINVADGKNGTAVGNYGTIITTNDSGFTWNLRNSGTTRKLNSVSIDPDNYRNQFVAGDSGFIARSVDGGITWAQEETNTTKNINKLVVVDSSHVWAVGDSGLILTNSPVISPPAPPSTVTLKNVYSDSAAISWQADSGYSNVIVSGRNENETEYSEKATIPGNYSEYTITGLTEGTRYWYYLQSEQNGLRSSPSSIVTFRSRLKTPQLSTDEVDSGVVVLWNNQSSKANSVYIDRYDSGYVNEKNMYKVEFNEKTDYDFIQLAVVDISENSYFDNTVVPGNLYLYRVKVVNDSTDSEYSNIVSARIEPTGIEDENELPDEYALLQNYPNPFNPSTSIKYAIPFFANNPKVSLKIYDLLGKEVKTLVNEKQPPGFYEQKWEAVNNASGIYFYVLEVSGEQHFRNVKKMIFLK